MLELVTGGLYVFVASSMFDKQDEFSGLEGLCVQLAALRSSHNTTVGRGLHLFSISNPFLSLSLSALHSVCVCRLLRRALTRFSPKLCLGPE